MPRFNRWWMVAAMCFAAFMTTLDNTVVNVALPTIQRDLHLSVAGLEWIAAGFILAFASLLLAGGRLADLYGHRVVFLSGLTVFTLASLGGGFAHSQAGLVSARVVQGAGAALLAPTTLAILAAHFEERERTVAIGIWTSVSAVAFAFGPLTGGFLAEHVHWSWIFFINVPTGVLTFVLSAITLPPAKRIIGSRSLDWSGLAASAAGFFALTFALIQGHDYGWTSPIILAAFAAAGLALACFGLVELRNADPMLDVRLFRNRVFSGGSTVMVLWGFAIMGVYFFVSLFMQGVLRFSPTEAGLAFLPMALMLIVFAPLSGRAAQIAGTNWAVAGGLVLVAGGLASFSLVGPGSSFLALLPGLVLIGVGSALTTPLTSSLLGVMPADQSGVGSGVLQTLREVAGALGIALLGAILLSRQSAALAAGESPLQAFTTGYSTALLIAAALVLASAGIAAVLIHPTTVPEADVARAAA